MEEAKGVVKHIVLAKFKEGTTDEKIEDLAKTFSKLMDVIEPFKGFHWGKDISVDNMHQGYTHVFECTFESMEGVAEYMHHPEHDAFASVFTTFVESLIILDYKPIVISNP